MEKLNLDSINFLSGPLLPLLKIEHFRKNYFLNGPFPASFSSFLSGMAHF